ncbi:hypothetical protein HELRODRAFT_165052 [Helobdella robusta]|uniref:FLYWCH-type domain-containing protein n=1 Tax=Helobdella robusta TaxID=6412 RepID=T1EW75_HELRO|nr:hypothetical protein HELRODRAFT_165052 [Helobdella robusta]ESN92916.1 hypothetical protein HELRODRAFT_165052 [Helobdella robusta]
MAQYSMYKSHQGGNVLAYNGHEYLYKRSNQDGSIVWRCQKYFSLKCHVTLTTKGQQIIKQPNDHEHPELWNRTNDALACAPKTTNASEGYHHALNAMFSCHHPGVWKLFQGIKNDIGVQRLVAVQTRNGIETTRNKYKALAETLSAKVQGYGTEPDKLRYLRQIAHLQVS